MKISSIIWLVVIIGLALVALNLSVARKPFADVESFTIQEIAPQRLGKII